MSWYECAQGLTGLTLTITGDDEQTSVHDIEGHFSFYAVDANPNVPSGAFTMSGRHSSADDAVALIAGEWITRPFGYETVNLAGGLEADTAQGDVIRGVVDFIVAPQACTVFEVRREAVPVS